MKDNLKLLFKYFLRIILKVYWVFPIKRKTVFFMANMGKGYLCNPKYLYESMICDEEFVEYNYIWCFSQIDDLDVLSFPNNTKLISRKKVLLYFYYLLTSEIIVYNCGGFSYAPIRKTQYLIETWHGGGASKRVGHTVPGKSYASKKGITLASKDIKLFISSSAISTRYVIRESLDYHGEILESGFPRNDIMFYHDYEQIRIIKERIGIPKDTHIVLYAPTFRGNEDRAVNIDYEFEIINPSLVKDALCKKYGGTWLFVTRGHQYASDMNIENSDLDVSTYSDMQEILLISDVLITDYSSSIWDFAILKRPAFLYVPDLDKYERKERGFLVPIEKWPGIISQSNEEIAMNILNFSDEEYSDHLTVFFRFANSYEHGNACESVKNKIRLYDDTKCKSWKC